MRGMWLDTELVDQLRAQALASQYMATGRPDNGAEFQAGFLTAIGLLATALGVFPALIAMQPKVWRSEQGQAVIKHLLPEAHRPGTGTELEVR